MAVLKMSTVKLIGPLKQLDKVIEICAESGYFEPEPAKNFFGDLSNYTEFNKQNPYSEPLKRIADAVEASDRVLKKVSIKDFIISDEQIKLFSDRIICDVADIQESRDLLVKENEDFTLQIEQLSHFKSITVPLESMFKSEFLKARFGRIPVESYNKLKEYDDNPYVMFFPCETDEYCWGMYIAPINHIREVDRIFSSIYFEKIIVPPADVTPAQAIERLEEQKRQNEESIKIYNDRMEKYWLKEYDLCLKVYTFLYQHEKAFELKRYAMVYSNEGGVGDSFIYSGFVPSKYAEQFREKLLKIPETEIEIEASDRKSHVVIPTLLKNNVFSKPYEFYVEMFGTPNYNEIDPTLFVGLTYTVLFGIMFADVGHGLVLALVAWLLWKLKGMKLGPILLRCGISSAFFGVVFGSVFGYEHLLDPFYKAVFGLNEKPIEIMDSSSIIKILFVPVGIGAALILFAMILNMAAGFKQRNFEKALFSNNGAAGFVFYGSIAFAAAEFVLFNRNVISTGYILGFLVFPILLMMFKDILAGLLEKDKHPFPEKWGDYIVQNFFEVFDYLISYMSNTISFMRVGAFVLIHAIMMKVVFVMAEMMNPVGYVIMVIFGNIFVLGLEALLVSIQGLRLEFYEMFSRFFEGDGRPFKPVKSLKINK